MLLVHESLEELSQRLVDLLLLHQLRLEFQDSIVESLYTVVLSASQVLTTTT